MHAWNQLFQGHGIVKITSTYGRDHQFGITKDSVVVVSAVEMGFETGEERPFFGAANITVLSVAPQPNGNVDFKVNVAWDSDLHVRASIVAFPAAQ